MSEDSNAPKLQAQVDKFQQRKIDLEAKLAERKAQLAHNTASLKGLTKWRVYIFMYAVIFGFVGVVAGLLFDIKITTTLVPAFVLGIVYIVLRLYKPFQKP